MMDDFVTLSLAGFYTFVAELPQFLLDELLLLVATPVLFASFLELAERLDRSLAKFASTLS